MFFTQVWDKDLLNLQEQVNALYLNSNNEVISWRCLNTGTCAETLFDIKLTLSCALICMASKIIIAHNHPSGKLQPSYNDITITNKLNQASALMDIQLEDHLIISRLGYYSFKDTRILKA